MPSPETVELRGRTDEQLHTDLNEAHQALFNLRFQAATHQLADNQQVGKARRRVARIHTLLRERDILAELDAAIASDEDLDEATAETTADTPIADEAVDDELTDEVEETGEDDDEADDDKTDTDETDEDETDEDETDDSSDDEERED